MVYAGDAGLVLQPTPGDQRGQDPGAPSTICEAGGSTNGAGGIQLAYDLAEQALHPERHQPRHPRHRRRLQRRRSTTRRLIQLVEQERAKGVASPPWASARGNYNDQLMEQLADKGNGNYAYIDTLQEARKVLVERNGRARW